MKKEKSCGAVVCRKGENGLEILLIQHKNGGHWAFPKGHVEKKETEEETALREALDTAFRKMVTYSPKPGVMKDVIYFAAKAKKDGARPQPEEVLELCWKSPEEALEAVTYDTDRQVLQAFLEYHKKASEK